MAGFLPQTRWFDELLEGEQTTPDVDEALEGVPEDDPRYLMLQIKKKHRNNILKRMLAEGGYPELARMTSLRKTGFDGGDQ